MSTNVSTYDAQIPRELVGSCQFRAYVWGTSTRRVFGGEEVWVTLSIDFGIQVSCRVLVRAEHIKAVMERKLRRIKLLADDQGNLIVDGIHLDGHSVWQDEAGYAHPVGA